MREALAVAYPPQVEEFHVTALPTALRWSGDDVRYSWEDSHSTSTRSKAGQMTWKAWPDPKVGRDRAFHALTWPGPEHDRA